jgi:uncharacterized protein (DUF983 family)
MKEDSIKYSILNLKCPRCHQGDLFVYKNHFKLMSGFMKMNKNCPVCNQTFNPEPGFYFGAAYISYAIGSAICLAAFLVSFFGFHLRTPGTLIPAIFVPLILLAPINYRFSRSIWANMFIRYKKPQASK